jgi:hypothetical protein
MATPAPQTRVFWDDKFWDRTVHRFFKEELLFFLVKLKPFRHREIARELNRINRDLQLGSVHAFKIMGQFDLLIRAWLHRDVVAQFGECLTKLPDFYNYHEFRVLSLDNAWFSEGVEAADSRLRTQLIAELDHNKLREIESGTDVEAYQRYHDAGLVIERPLLDSHITFFVGVNFAIGPPDNSMATICSTMREYIGTALRSVKRIVVDRGKGLYEILIKGESADFFEIGRLPAWISETFHANRAITETHLSHGVEPIAGDGRLSIATLHSLGGFDPWVKEIVPDLYPKKGEKLREEIERFLRNRRRQIHTQGQRKFLEKFLSGVLDGVGASSAQAIFLLFWELELFLSRNCGKFLGREFNATMEQCAVKDPKRLTLTDLLQIYTKSLQGKGVDLNPFIDRTTGERTNGWNAFVQLRNDSIHPNYDPLEKWEEVCRTVLDYWNHVLAVTGEISKRTNNSFIATFWP